MAEDGDFKKPIVMACKPWGLIILWNDRECKEFLDKIRESMLR